MSKTQHNNPIESKLLAGLDREEYCYLATRGRITGRPHEIEIWFVLMNLTLYLLSGGGESSDWVKNMHAQSNVKVRLGNRTFRGQARFLMEEGEEQNARLLLAAKYQGWRKGLKLSEWARTALPVAVDLSALME